MEFVIEHWREPDDGIWESRGERRHFVFSKALCWVALDRAIRAAEETGLPAELERWRAEREVIHADVLARGYDAARGAFTRAYGDPELDASVLMLRLFGFIGADDPRMRSTVALIEQELTTPDGFVYRYRHERFDDGVGGPEGAFNICTLWLCNNLVLTGEVERARELFRRVCRSANDLGLLSEQTDAEQGMLGNFPQAFSHLALINAAVNIARAERAR